jgi:hypothetical protein
MLDHHDLLAFLPDIHYAGVGEEYDHDEPPDQVPSGVLAQWRYLRETDREVPNVDLDVALITMQIELIAGFDGHTLLEARCQGVQSFK